MANIVYNIFKERIAANTINLLSDSIKVILVYNYVPNVNHVKYSDITNEVPTGNGYFQGGVQLLNRDISLDTTNNKSRFSADPVEWTTSSIIATGAILYEDTTTPKYLICYADFGTIKQSENDSFKIQWNSEGIITFN